MTSASISGGINMYSIYRRYGNKRIHYRRHRAPWQWGGHLGVQTATHWHNLIPHLLGAMLWVKVRRNKNPVMTDYRERDSRDSLSPQKGNERDKCRYRWTEWRETGREQDGWQNRIDFCPVLWISSWLLRVSVIFASQWHLVSKEQNITPLTVLDRGTEETEKMDIMGGIGLPVAFSPGQVPLMARYHWWGLCQQLCVVERDPWCAFTAPFFPCRGL